MNYRPNPKQWRLWDTWMFADPDGQRMHLFYLANPPDGHWEWIGHAISHDLIHWQELPAIPAVRPGDRYDVRYIGTGMVFAAPNGEYLMSYTANLGATRSRIGFLHSRDLMNWEKRWHEPCIEAQPPYYQTDVTQSPTAHPAFRDAYVHRVGDHYEALICADTTEPCDSMLGGVIARYRSASDDLRQWQSLPPPIGPNLAVMMEVPEHFQIGGKHYLLWSNSSETGILLNTPQRRRTTGTYYAVAARYEGPYTCPPDNLLIGAGDPNACHSYVGRTILWRGERLLYHHQGPPLPALGFPKRIVPQSDGSLKLGYWPGIEQVHGHRCAISLDRVREVSHRQVGQWRPTGPASLEGSIKTGGSLVLADAPALADIHLRCRVTASAAARWALTLRDANEPLAKRRGVALQADYQHGEWHVGQPVHHWCSRIDVLETIHDPPQPGQTYQLDLFARDIYFEAYVNGLWRFTRVLKHNDAPSGRIGFFVDTGTVRFEAIEVWELPLISHPFSE